jgi:mRNA-degrading endonuclease RelE of RelBE toxin-antitoxin system
MSEQQKHKNYRITIAPSAIKTLGTLENALRTRIQKRIEELADMPRHRQSKKLEGEDNLYRNRVGVYRIVLHDPRRQIDRPSSGHRPSTRDLRPRLSLVELLVLAREGQGGSEGHAMQGRSLVDGRTVQANLNRYWMMNSSYSIVFGLGANSTVRR